MSHISSVRDQKYYTSELTPFFREPSIVWGGFEALSFDRCAFAVPIRHNLTSLYRAATEHSLMTRSRIDLAGRVRRVVADTLSDGVPTLSAVASEMGLGPRTLQRRLSDSGQSFQGIVDLARKRLALRLLRETELSLAEIAFLTGFSEQSGFTRAFKRWAGQTPRSYRLATSSVGKSGSEASGRYSGGSEKERNEAHSNQLS
ncbi:MAG: AraC family transcriptional regulator [Hyphomonas sp.]|nr:AraC family transcriptional regulator [Hyphomonas sp.]